MDKDDGDALLSWCDEMEAKYTSPTEYDYGVLMAVAGLRQKLAALRQSGAGSKDAERYEWLCTDLDAEQRAKRSHLFNRMSVMGKGAIDAFIDAALKERTE